MDATAELNRLLSESVPEAAHREITTFENALKPFSKRVVIYGGGNLGRRTLAGLKGTGIEVIAFVDRNPMLWSQTIAGIPVYGPEEAALRFGSNALFVIALWHPTRTTGIESVSQMLRKLGCAGVISFAPLYWRYSSQYLPYYMWDLPSRAIHSAERVRFAFELFADSYNSQSRFVQQLRLRTHADFAYPEPPADHPAYFPPLFQPVSDECFIDCGAFDGDTVRVFLDWSNRSFSKVVAFEPDPRNADALEVFAGRDKSLKGRMEIFRNATGERADIVRFAASGKTDAAISAAGDIEVKCVTLDHILASQHATFIKMDIEGAEMSTLRGAREVIGRERPILAVCVYHQQDHLWEVPLTIHSQMAKARFGLFGYFMEGMETVCYAVPQERYLDGYGACP